jgi:sigma-B regulation protein RsbU (phosphoserine phosphatase)
VVVADSSGHGISAALHMTATRAFFKAGLQSDLAPEDLVRSINQHLVHDSRDSGWFITLFLLVIDPRQRRLRWIRAGHDPALLYDPVRDLFQELGGEGVALGVLTAPELKEYAREGWAAGSVVVLVTDGIREARNRPGEMFGAARLEAQVRRNAHEAAAVIRDRIIAELERFRDDRPLEDDATLVVVKLR